MSSYAEHALSRSQLKDLTEAVNASARSNHQEMKIFADALKRQHSETARVTTAMSNINIFLSQLARSDNEDP